MNYGKKFKVEKLEKYTEELSDTKKDIINNIIAFGGSTIGLAIVFGLGLSKIINFESISPYLIGAITTNSSFFAISLEDLLKSINEKTVLELNIDQINKELENLKLKEKKGVKR